MRIFAALAFAAMMTATAAFAAPRVALVIGNGGYTHVAALKIRRTMSV